MRHYYHHHWRTHCRTHRCTAVINDSDSNGGVSSCCCTATVNWCWPLLPTHYLEFHTLLKCPFIRLVLDESVITTALQTTAEVHSFTSSSSSPSGLFVTLSIVSTSSGVCQSANSSISTTFLFLFHFDKAKVSANWRHQSSALQLVHCIVPSLGGHPFGQSAVEAVRVGRGRRKERKKSCLRPGAVTEGCHCLFVCSFCLCLRRLYDDDEGNNKKNSNTNIPRDNRH